MQSVCRAREISHSALLAWLLNNPEYRSFAQAFLAEILVPGDQVPRRFAGPVVNQDELPLRPEELVLQRISCEAELGQLGRIDVLAEYSVGNDSGAGLVLATENKIHAGEAPDQIGGYSRALNERYADRGSHVILVFLTPNGRPPSSLRTSESALTVPRLFSWRRIGELLRDNPPHDEEHVAFARMTTQHIREDLMGDTSDKIWAYFDSVPPKTLTRKFAPAQTDRAVEL